jgi:hypothetical protein
MQLQYKQKHQPSDVMLNENIASIIFGFCSAKDYMNSLQTCKSLKKALENEIVKHCIVSLDIRQDFGDAPCDQYRLQKISESFTGLRYLNIALEFTDDDSNVLDFKNVRFPELREIELECVHLNDIYFTRENTPKLESLYMINCSAADVILDLEHLSKISMHHVELDDGDLFGESISKCPNLVEFDSYKLWGLGGCHQRISLPKCVSLNLYRADDLQELTISQAPELRYLNLQACYGISRIFLPPVAEGENYSPIDVNILNSGVDYYVLRYLREHPRCGMIEGYEGEEFAPEAGMDREAFERFYHDLNARAQYYEYEDDEYFDEYDEFDEDEDAYFG